MSAKTPLSPGRVLVTSDGDRFLVTKKMPNVRHLVHAGVPIPDFKPDDPAEKIAEFFYQFRVANQIDLKPGQTKIQHVINCQKNDGYALWALGPNDPPAAEN